MAKKLRKFLIILDNESLLYFPGSFLTGRVLVDLDEDTAVTGLYFHIVGEGVVRLSDRGSGGHHNDKENYIDFRMKLLGESNKREGSERTVESDRMIILSPGVHSFPFKLGLPLGLPSTFLGKHGWVQYFCKTALKEPSGLTHKNQQVFIVMNPIDLNLEPSLLMQPFHCEVEDTLGIPCLNAGPVSCRVRLDRGGYVPGESICLFATIDNGSRITIKKTKAILTETIQYTAKSKIVQSETRELASLQKGKIDPGTTDHWKNEMLYIPPLPPTNLRGCHLIKIQYDVYFILEPKGVDRLLKLQLPIMIATYPIRNSDGTLQRRKGTSYPSTLPIFRPWLNTSKLK
ncbi:arrestin domain-containing protein 4 [Parasteatoda tepidariorum]|uniref:arrestin domain-containing protein 4 n=1 Tax=Parasteatoda tepidariorum TaxID=114398 RepID=UPI00077FD3EA|nr:arrestin domain-containing protein 4 [Parasteatoda tepidariorum]